MSISDAGGWKWTEMVSLCIQTLFVNTDAVILYGKRYHLHMHHSTFYEQFSIFTLNCMHKKHP